MLSLAYLEARVAKKLTFAQRIYQKRKAWLKAHPATARRYKKRAQEYARRRYQELKRQRYEMSTPCIRCGHAADHIFYGKCQAGQSVAEQMLRPKETFDHWLQRIAKQRCDCPIHISILPREKPAQSRSSKSSER